MNASDRRLFELALKKQRLTMTSDSLRDKLANGARILPPVFSALDRARAGARWLRRHPEVPVAVGVALVVSRPRRLWVWGQRAFVAWQTWRRARGLVEAALARHP